MPKNNDDEKTYTRHNSLRLPAFDYSSRGVYFVTIVVSERRPLFNDKFLAQSTIDCLLNLRKQFGFCLFSYCLMPDHFHALIGPGQSGRTLGQICGAFKSLSTRAYWKR